MYAYVYVTICMGRSKVAILGSASRGKEEYKQMWLPWKAKHMTCTYKNL